MTYIAKPAAPIMRHVILALSLAAAGLPTSTLAQGQPWQQAYGADVARQHYESISRGTCDRPLMARTSTAPHFGEVGGPLGGVVGQSMTLTDQGCIEQTLEHARDGQTVSWRNPESRARYQATPTRTYQAQNGGYCREYSTTGPVAGQRERVDGTACRQNDGNWQVLTAALPPWTPPGGYQPQQAGQPYAVDAKGRVVPIQQQGSIVNGTCDRSLVSGALSTTPENIIGSLLGGAVGGLVGNQFGGGSGKTALTVLGAVAGALAGGTIGRSMAPADQHCIGQTLEHAPVGQTVAWRNPDNGTQYQVTPVRTYQGSGGLQCRDYTTAATISGRRERLNGSACRHEDGTWAQTAG